MPRAMSSGLDSSSGEWLTPPFRLRTKSIPVGHAGRGQDRGVVAGAGDELGRAGRGRAQRLERRAAHRGGLGEVDRRRSRSLGDERGRARPDRRRAPRPRAVTREGTTLTAPGSTCRRPTVATVPGPGRARDVQHVLGGAEQRVVARRPSASCRRGRRGPEDDLAAGDPGDRGHDPDRLVRPLEHGPLLDVQLEVGLGKPAGAAQALLPAQPRSSSRKATTASGTSSRLGQLEPGDDPEHAVEAAAVRARSRGATRPRRAPSPRRPNVLPAGVDLDLEPGLAHPDAPRAGAPRPPRASRRRASAPMAYICSSRSRTRSIRPFWTVPGTVPGRVRTLALVRATQLPITTAAAR